MVVDEVLLNENDIISLMRPKRICLCRQVTEEDLVKAIHEGYDSFEKLVEHTLATTGCGTCSGSVKVILEKELSKIKKV